MPASTFDLFSCNGLLLHIKVADPGSPFFVNQLSIFFFFFFSISYFFFENKSRFIYLCIFFWLRERLLLGLTILQLKRRCIEFHQSTKKKRRLPTQSMWLTPMEEAEFPFASYYSITRIIIAWFCIRFPAETTILHQKNSIFDFLAHLFLSRIFEQ